MKNSARYAKKIKKLFRDPSRPAPERGDAARLMVAAVLAEDVTSRQGAAAMAAVEEEFVDFNDLRVSPVKDITDCLGREFPGRHDKASSINRALNAIFEHTNALSLDFLADQPKREVRKLLRQKFGLSLYAESMVTLYAFDGHAIPVDRLLLDSLQDGDTIDADSDLADLQGFLERIVAAKDDHHVHESLRQFCGKHAAKWHKEWARQAQKAAEARAKAEAAARARAEAAAKAKAEAAAKAAAKAEKEAADAKKKAAEARKKKTAAKKKAAAKKRAAAKTARKKPAAKKKKAAKKKGSRRLQKK